MPRSLRNLAITFNPDLEKEFVSTAFCSVTGLKEPLKLSLCGEGRGPEIEFSFTSLNVGKILVTTKKALDLVLHNRSDIEASYSMHLHSDDYEVMPLEGIVVANGYQVVTVTLRSLYLGPFTHCIDIEISGSLRMKTVSISGEVVPPELLIEPSPLDFGRVAFGFEVTKKMTVKNPSAILIPVTFEVGTHLLKVSPSQVLLQGMDVIEAEITYSAVDVDITDSRIYINMKSVGNIFEIPVVAKCCVPQIQAQFSQIELQSCFLNHPREFAVHLLNPSDLPAMYHVQPKENINVHLVVTSSEGVLPPGEVTIVSLRAYAKVTGVVPARLEILIDGADYNPLVVEVICYCVGPVLFVKAKKVDFGEIEALTPTQRIIPLSNESPIPAHLTNIRVQKSTVFHVSPSETTIPPFGKGEIKVTACADEVDVKLSGLLEIYVQSAEASPYTLPLQAIGVGSTIVIEPEMSPNLSLGQQFESLVQTKVFAIKNCGRRQQRLVWTTENILCIQNAESRKKPKHSEYLIKLDPPKFELKSLQGVDLSLMVSSGRAMEIRFTLKCHTVIDNAGHKRLLRECTVSAEFIKPMIEVAPNPINFCLLKSTVLTNLTGIETTIQVVVNEPFFLIEYARLAQSLELTLSGRGERRFWIGFNPRLWNNRNTSFVVDEHLSISFLKHPSKLAIPIRGEVWFPSLQLETNLLDFGCVENGSEVQKCLILFNNSPIEVSYQWKLTHGFLKNNPKEQLRLPTRSKSQELRPAPEAPLVHASSIAKIDALHITDVFTITPESNIVAAGESVSTCINFHAPSDVSARCVAVCDVTDGLSYTVDLVGECSTSDCYVRTNEVSFGEIQFGVEVTESFHIYNAGKVPSSFCFTWDKNDVKLRILPMEGEVPGKGLAEVTVYAEVPKPMAFTVFAKVHLDGKHPEPIMVHGMACFPHLVLDSPRPDGKSPRRNNLCKVEVEFLTSQLTVELPSLPLTLPSYELDLYDINQGEVKERKLTFRQLGHNFACHPHIEKMDRKLLGKRGVTVQIEDKISIAFDSSNSETGHIALEIPLKVVAPNLEISEDRLDFGEVYMDEAKILAVQLHNPTPFSMNWSESRLQATASAFEVMPRGGCLQPDQRTNVFIKYNPRISGPVRETINLHLRESKAELSVTCQGVGLEPHLIFQPHIVEFKPLLPNGETDEQVIFVKNPCPFPVEFYSLDFDQEERCLTSLPMFDEAEEVLLPPRKPRESLAVELSQVKESNVGIPKVRISVDLVSSNFIADESPEEFTTRYVEERQIGVEGTGIVLLIFGSPLSGKNDLAKSLAQYYNAANLNLEEFFATLDTTVSQNSEEVALSGRLMLSDCTFGLVVSEINSSKRCEVVLKALGKKAIHVFAVTVVRDIASINLADARYEEALSKAEEHAFECKVRKYRDLEEWQYDTLSDSARAEVNSILVKWKCQQQHMKSKEVKEFEKEHRRTCHLLSTWDTKNQEQNLNGATRPPTDLKSPKHVSSHDPGESLVGIAHFVVHSKLDVEIGEANADRIFECVKDVQRESPNISMMVDSLLAHLPAREEIRRQLGYGPLPIDVPTAMTFSVLRRPAERKKCDELNPFFTIVKASVLAVLYRILAGEYKENVTELQLQNDGLLDVEVKLTFEDDKEDENFAVSPTELHIYRDEMKVVKVYALPTTNVIATSKLIGWIRNNPEPIKWDFAVIGVLPNLTVQTNVVNFGKIPLNKTERQQILILNPTQIPIAWKCEFLGSSKENSFRVFPSTGILKSSNDMVNITVEYDGSPIPQKIAIKKWLRFVAMDTRGLSNPMVIQPPVGVQVEVVDPKFEIFMPKVEVCSPSLEIVDLTSIFEEHQICQSLNELESLANHGIVGATYIENENCFDFGTTPIGVASRGRFRISNNSKAALDLSFVLRQAKSERKRKTRRNDTNALEAFNVFPAVSHIEPYQSVYVDCSFTSNSLGIFSTIFQVLTEGERAPLLQFDLRGKGQLPHAIVEEPTSRNSRGHLYLLFNKYHASKAIVIRNDRVIPCQVNVNVETTEGHYEAFGLGDCHFGNEDGVTSDVRQTSVNFTLAAGDTRSLEVTFMPMKHNISGRVIGCIKIFFQGNNYDKEVIELCGVFPSELISTPQIQLPHSTTEFEDFEGEILETAMNHMRFGNCYVGSTITERLVISYPAKTEENDCTAFKDGKPQAFTFSWPQDHPHLQFEPATGELRPGSSLSVFVKFRSDRPAVYHMSPVRCELTKLSKEELQKDHFKIIGNEGVDKAHPCARSAGSLPRRVMGSPKLKSDYQPDIHSEDTLRYSAVDDEKMVQEKTTFLDFYFTVDCDFVEYLCEANSIEFADTPLYCETVKTSFEITNASESCIELGVNKVDPSDKTMDVVLSATTIEPGHSINVEVSFVSQTKETKEVCVIFETTGYRKPLLLVGQVREAIVAFDRSHLRLPEVPIGREVEKVVHLVNTEAFSVNFKIIRSTLQCNDSPDKILVSPMAGCVQPHEK
ncbi:unnamed protein product [Hydatigera taeniaeformis]|uniref:MSP domain-containing protein n=1 Tax=Hydatigena taeniaeformis TaxID=6205 RepID=A0A158RDS4_HYDTA|nr:unnamed protein product [Hydatigera taeniaeformis]